MGRGILLCIAAVLGAAAFTITYLATYDGYERMKNGKASPGIVRQITDDVVEYDMVLDGGERQGPYRTSDVPADARAGLRPGSEVTIMSSSTQSELALALRPPSPLLIGGAVGCLALGAWFIVAPIRVRRAFERARGDCDRILRLALSRARGQHIVVAVFAAAAAAFFVVVTFADPEATGGMITFIWALAAVCLVFTAISVRRAWALRDNAERGLLRRLRERPRELVWVYQLIVQNSTAGPAGDYSTVMLNFSDGSSFPVMLGQIGVEDFLGAMKERFGHAHFGYAREVERAFKADPAAFVAG
jgi:hypothetical protein